MTDPLRSDRLPIAADVTERDRDARIEELLLAGLDHYFSEQHELAINVWTRVLFLDRGHARARAYIERARSAVAERQRMGDELLHTGNAAFNNGDAQGARLLVASAVEHGASPDEALALLARIDRVELATAPGRVTRNPESRAAVVRPNAPAAGFARWRWIGAGVLAGLLLATVALGLLVQGGVVSWLFPAAEQRSASTLKATLPVPSIAEVALSRGESLRVRGQLHDALAALEAVPGGDPLRPRADALTAQIQRQLLAAARSGQRPPSDPGGRRP
ncbi:MAG TPA: hypothetical protein VM493_05465 [Vicinamibacterales bacterium]|nr:hypothetical protein [Vicinamibacterales bacterium]